MNASYSHSVRSLCAVLAVLLVTLVACGDSDAPPADRPSLPTSTPKVEPLEPPAMLADPTLSLDFVSSGSPDQREKLSISLSIAPDRMLVCDWRYQAPTLSGSLLPKDYFSVLLTSDRKSIQIVHVVLSPTDLAPDGEARLYHYKEGEVKYTELETINFGSSGVHHDGLVLTGSVCMRLPGSEADQIGIGAAYYSLEADAPPRIRAGIPLVAQGLPDPAHYLHFTPSKLPQAAADRIQPLVASHRSRASLRQVLLQELDQLRGELQKAAQIPSLQQRHLESQRLESARTSTLREAVKDHPRNVAVVQRALAFIPPDEMDLDLMLAPARIGPLHVPMSLAYANRLLQRGRIEEFLAVAEECAKISASVGQESLGATIDALCSMGPMTIPSIAISTGHAEAAHRTAARMSSLVDANLPRPAGLAVMDLVAALAQPAAQEAGAIRSASASINRLVEVGLFSGFLNRLWRLHEIQPKPSPELVATHWRRLLGAAGEATAGDLVAKTIILSVDSALRQGDAARALMVGKVLGSPPPAFLKWGEESKEQRLWRAALETARALSTEDVLSALKQAEQTLAPADGSGDPRPDFLVQSLRTLRAAWGRHPKYRDENVHRELCKLVKERLPAADVPGVLHDHANFLLTTGLHPSLVVEILGSSQELTALTSTLTTDESVPLRNALRKLAFSAHLFAAGTSVESASELWATLTAAEREIAVAGITRIADREADKGMIQYYAAFGRTHQIASARSKLELLLAPSEDKKARLSLLGCWADVMSTLGSITEAERAADQLDGLLLELGPEAAKRFRESTLAKMLRMRIAVRKGDLPLALKLAEQWHAENPNHPDRGPIDDLKRRIELAISTADDPKLFPKGWTEQLPLARIHTELGPIDIALLANEAPNTVAHFLKEAESGTWNGVVVSFSDGNFAQIGGDTLAGVRYLSHRIPLEATRPHVRGSVGFARLTRESAGPEAEDSADINWYFTIQPHSGVNHDGQFAVFAQVTDGFDVMDRLRSHHRIVSIEILRKPATELPLRRFPARFE